MSKPSKVVFLATLPSPEINDLIATLRLDFWVLHCGFDYTSDYGKDFLINSNRVPAAAISEILSWEEMPLEDQLIRQENFSIRICDAVVYNLDLDPGERYLMAAWNHGQKPLVAISRLLQSQKLSPYFSGYLQQILKPKYLKAWIDDVIVDAPNPSVE